VLLACGVLLIFLLAPDAYTVFGLLFDLVAGGVLAGRAWPFAGTPTAPSGAISTPRAPCLIH